MSVQRYVRICDFGVFLARRVCGIFFADIGLKCRVQNIREMLQSVYYNVHVMKKMNMYVKTDTKNAI